jgi:hypothetical protein
MAEKSRRAGANQPARKEANDNNISAPTSSLAPRQSQALQRATCLRAGRATAPSGLRPPPPLDIDRVAAALRRAHRLRDRDYAFVDAVAERRRVSDRERWALIDVADQLNLGPEDP